MAERSLGWYWNRLRSMSPAEVAYRTGEKWRRVTARGRLEGWARYEDVGGRVEIPGLRDAWLSARDNAKASVRTAALGVVAGRFEALGQTWVLPRGGEPFDSSLWRRDPVTGTFWPGAERYCFDIPYRHERVRGDVKFVWECNRLQFLQPVAALAGHGDDARAAAYIDAAIESWFEANPPFRGVSWNSGIELALRSISLLVVGSLCGDQLAPMTRQRIRRMLAAHLAWLSRFPSRYSSANNHLVAEAAGEFLITLCLPSLPGAADISRKARTVLSAEASKQLLPDGFGAEQSPTYAAFTTEFLLLAGAAARATDTPLDDVVDERLLAFVDTMRLLSAHGQELPSIGDDDEGRVLGSALDEPAYPLSVARATAAYLGVEPPPAVAGPGTLRDACFYPKRPVWAAPLPSRRTLVDGGYTVIHEQRAGRRLWLMIDHGPLGYLSIAAHGHADALSVVMSLDGEPVLVDPGTFLYHAGAGWRDWFRGTPAHNTLSMAGVNQSIITGPFNWGAKALSRLERFDGNDSWSLCASHDGYLRRFGCLHRREMSALPDGILVSDSLPGARHTLPVEVVFQFDPGIDVSLDGNEASLTRGGQTLARVTFDAGGIVHAQCGASTHDGGWVSPRFGRRVAAWRIVWKGMLDERPVRTRLVW